MPPLLELSRLLASGAWAVALLAALYASPLTAQSTLRGGLDGSVRGSDGSVPAGIRIELTESRTGKAAVLEIERDGSFGAQALASGAYQLRIEARGFRPRVVTGIRIAPGRSARVDAVLVAEPPPVQRIDTVPASAAGSARFDGLGGWRAEGEDFVAFSTRGMGWPGAASLAPSFDLDFVAEGLPSGTAVVLDGLAFTPAVHPRGVAAGQPTVLIPSLGLAALEVHRRADVEWLDGAGTQLVLTSRPGGAVPAAGLAVAGSTAGLWTSEDLSSEAASDASALWGGLAFDVPMSSERSQLRISAEGGELLVPHLPPGGVAGLALLNSLATGGDLAAPWVERRRAAAVATRLGWSAADATDVIAQTSFSTFSSVGGELFGRSTVDGGSGPLEGTDFLASASVFAPGPRGSVLELKGGVVGSRRSWGGEDGGAVPSTRLVGVGVLLGAEPGRSATVSRVTAQGGLSLHLPLGEQGVKAGVAISAPWHEIEHWEGTPGEFVAGDDQGLTAGRYLFVGQEGGTPAIRFLAPQVGGFLQHRWEPAPSLKVTTGIRFDVELLPAAGAPPDEDWLARTGLRTDELPSQLKKVSPRVDLEWDPGANGATVLKAAFGIHHGLLDPGALHEVLAGARGVRRALGEFPSWPAPPPGSPVRNSLALFGPKVEAPRTARGALGLSQRLGPGTLLHIWGTVRTTQFLLRRVDLNRAHRPGGRSSEDRPLYGRLVKLGSAVVTEPGTDRRFAELDAVWGLTADGWSRYQGGSIALEHRVAGTLDVFAHYTRSLTEDNLIGAGTSPVAARVDPALDDSPNADPWGRGVSDFDVPDRAGVGARLLVPLLAGGEVTAAYRFRSGLPFTAGYRAGVDVNGDGSWLNDPAFVGSGGGELDSCVVADVGAVARRNGCRGKGVHNLDAHVRIGLFRVGRSVASLGVDVFNVLDAELGRPDGALWLVRSDAPLTVDGATGFTAIPLERNPDFGRVLETVRPGRLLRVTFTVALP